MIDIKGKVLLAPMCDVTSLPFRVLCRRYGAAIVYTEMIYADAYVMGNEMTEKRAQFLEEERPIGVQLAGSSIEMLKKAAVKAQYELKPDLIDINFGCPSYNVMKNGSGAAALQDLTFLRKLVSTLSDSLSIPLTCKMRILPSEQETIEAAELIEKSGAAVLTVHGRTASQQYRGEADWEIIRMIADRLSIPVVLNGDVKDEESAKKALSYADAVMIGRAALKNPFVFRRITHYLETGKTLPERSFAEKAGDFRHIVELCRKYDYVDFKSLKMLAHNFTKGMEGGSEVRRRITQCNTVDEMVAVLNQQAS